MASAKNADGSVNYFARHPDAVGASPTPEHHPNQSIKKNVKGPGPASGSYVSNEQQQVSNKAGH
jgi:hypothetical protein